MANSLQKLIKNLVVRGERKAVEQGEKGLVKTSKKLGKEDIDAAFRDVTDSMPPTPPVSPSATGTPWYKDPKKLGVILGGAGLAGSMLSGKEEPTPPVVREPDSVPVQEPAIKRIRAKLSTPKKQAPLPVEEVKSPEIKPAGDEDILSAKTGESVVEPVVPEMDIGERQTDPLEALEGAQRKRDQQVLINQLGAISERAGASIGGYKPLYGDVYQGGIDRAGQHVEDVKEKMRLEENDPKSPTSKAFKAYVEKFGGLKIKGDLDAGTAKSLLPVVYKEFEDKVNKEARIEAAKLEKQFKSEEAEKLRQHQEFLKKMDVDARKEQARLLADAKKEENIQRREDTNDKWISQRYDKIIASKPYQAYNKIDRAKGLVDEAVKNPTGFGDIATLYSAITALDPESVVREGEIKLSKDAASIWGNISTGISRLGPNPRVIPDALLKDMHRYINSIHKQSKDQYHDSIGPVIEQAKKRDISESRFGEIDPMYLKEQKTKESQPKSDPKIEQYAKQYGLDYNKAEKILRSRGYSGQ